MAQDSWRAKLFRLPSVFLPDPVGAIVEKELRTLSRTPRFRLVFIMGFTFGLVVWLPMIIGRSVTHSSMAENFLTLVCLYSLALLGQVTYWNAFGFDRSAVQAYFAWPVPISLALVGKNLAAAIFVLLEVLMVTAACWLLRMQPSPHKILEAYLVTPVVAMYLLAGGNLSSVHLPRPLNAERVAQGGSAGRSQAIMLLIYPMALLPVLLAYGARYAFNSDMAFYLLLAFAAVLGAVFYWLALESAGTAAERRKEQIITELTRNEGPVSTE
jgi:ABC-2 type transport system permease protein